ncbi:hypothetical protein GEMRC1_010774 [Eukaryota sp. GEM-RC1]
MISLGSELGLPSSIIRSDWTGNHRLRIKRKRPSFLTPDDVTRDEEWFESITRINMFYNHLVTTNALWHSDFSLSVDEFPLLNQPDIKYQYSGMVIGQTVFLYVHFLLILVWILPLFLNFLLKRREGKSFFLHFKPSRKYSLEDSIPLKSVV